jgi:urease accessory protein
MKRTALIALALLAATPALAHPGHGGGFSAGFGHPFGGLDHVLAMLAVGLWAAIRRDGAMLVWPAAFVGAMIAGFGATQAGLVVPAVETMIVASVVLLGAAIAFRLVAPVLLGAAPIALFGFMHGAAHGMELAGAAMPFAMGFVLASLILHGAGIGLAVLAQRLSVLWPARLAGTAMALTGLALAINL